MDLELLCQKLGIDYQQLKAKGLNDSEIQSMANNIQKIKNSNKKFWNFKMLDETKQEAELVLYGTLADSEFWGDEVTPKQFNDDLTSLGSINSLNVRINSPGGDVFAGSSIYSMLKRLKAQVNVYIDGVAASAASVIAMAGNKVIMPKNAMLMLHNPWTGVVGNSDKLRKTADTLDQVGEAMMTAYMDKSGKSKEEITKIMKAETWMTAQEAVDLGFADEIENTEILMCIDNSSAIINGIKFEIKNFPIKNNHNKSDSELEKGENLMNLQQLCEIYGLNYGALVEKGMTEDQIRAELAGKIQAKTPNTPVITSTEQKDEKAILAHAQERFLNISALCKEFGVKDEDRDGYIKADMTIDQVNAKVLESLKTKMPPVQASVHNLIVGEAEEDKIRAAASDGIMMREGIKIDKPAPGASDFRNMSMRDMAIDILMRAGVNSPHKLPQDELFNMALTPDSELSSIYTNTVNKSLAKAYQAAIPTCMAWVGTGSNKDFKTTQHYQISEAGDLEEMTQTGEFKHDEISDQGVSKRVKTFGKSFGFTRQAIINDDLSVITKLPMSYVRAAMRLRNRKVYEILGKNPNFTYINNKGVTVSKSLFHSDNKNLAATPATISTTSLSAGRKAMRTQKNLRNIETLNITPQFLIVPASLETVAAQLLRSTADPQGNNAGVANIYANSMDLIVDAELDQYSETEWYMAANSMDIDTIEITFLNGKDQPTLLTSQGGTDYLGVKWAIFDDFGVTALDYRGLYANAGA